MAVSRAIKPDTHNVTELLLSSQLVKDRIHKHGVEEGRLDP